MIKYKALALTTSYWRPGDNYTVKIINTLESKVENGDFVVVSEKAICVAKGNIIDESSIQPGLTAKFLAGFWMRKIWGYPLGMLSGFGYRLLTRLRNYPFESGSRHKQVSLEQAGLLQALMFGSEGGIDGSNLAYSYVSLPLENADELAGQIQRQVMLKLHKNICVIIADTDKTYRYRNFFFAPRPKPLKGIYSFGGILAFLAGRLLGLKRSSTPLAVAGCNLSDGEALTITNIADRARGAGSGATVWDMAARFGVDLGSVTWEMLVAVRHKPLVVVRSNFASGKIKR